MLQSATATQSQLQNLTEPAYAAIVSLVGRVLLAAIFIISGVGKIAAPASTIGYMASAGLPLPKLALVIAVLVELVGGVALIAGYRVRLVAGVIAVFCLVNALVFHMNLADQNQFIHFFKNIAMTGGLMQIVAFGGGRFSLDARRG
jgi:putative oxidoreductase